MNINDILSRANQIDEESFQKYDELKNVKPVFVGAQNITNDSEDEYEYIDTRAASFDVKINVCKWITRKYNDKQDGKYNLSVRKNGMMVYPEALTKLACEQAYNYLLSDYACITSDTGRTITLDYTTLVSGVTTDKTHTMQVRDHNSSKFNGYLWKWNSTEKKYKESTTKAVPIDWYLSFPYGIPFDMIEAHPDMRVFSYNSDTSNATVSPYKIASNCIACFDPRIDHNNDYPDCRYIVVVIGAGSKFTASTSRSSIIESWDDRTVSDPTTVMETGETIARNLYDEIVNGKTSTEAKAIIDKCLYCSISKVEKNGTYNILDSRYNSAITESRLHVITCGTQLLLAKYLQECGEDEIVDFEYETMRSYELSRPSQPKLEEDIYINECAGILTYGNNATIYNMTGSLEDVLLCALNSDNTYCTYALLLHYYKGLTHTSKDTIQPLIQQVASFDEGYIAITFPEANRSNVQTAGGESSLQYSSNKTTHSMKEPAPSSSSTPVSTTWPSLYTPTYNDYVYKVNLKDDYITFKDFYVDKEFTFTIAVKYSDIVAMSIGEILIATLGNAEIYFCKNTSVFSTIHTGENTTTYNATSSAIKIIHNKQQIYLGVGPIHTTVSTERDYNFIITISYSNGLWDIHKSHEGRGRN